MSANNQVKQNQPARPRGPMGHGAMGSGEKAKDFKGSMRQLFGCMKRYWILIIVAIIFAIVSTIFTIVGPKILGTATTEIASGLVSKAQGGAGINFDKIQDILVRLIGIYLISAIANYFQGFIMATISQRTAYRLRKDLDAKMNRLPLKYFDSTSQGDILSRVTNDIDTIGQSLNQSMSQVITSVITVIGIAYMMWTISWIMMLVAILVLPISGIAVAIVAKKSQKYFSDQQTSLGKVNGHVEEMYSGHTVVKAFNGESRSLTKFNEYNDQLYISAKKSQFLSGLMQPITIFIGNLGYVLVVLVGGVLAVNSKIVFLGITLSGAAVSIGDIQAFVQYVRQFNQPISQAAQIVNMLQSTAAAAERVFEFINAEEEVADSGNTVNIYDEDGNIKIPSTVMFDQVRFGYDPDKIIIKNFNMRVGDGQRIAIVGPTGAGKTTLVKLLMRFYELNSGDIFVGDVNIKDMKRADLRSMFGMVLQDAWLFNGTVMENLRYSKTDATDEEVYQAARLARVDHFVKTLEHGYDTMLNEDTSNVSSGQKQLFTIARAFLADPKILILDEATSNVDTRTEVLIQEGMDELMRGRTSFVIAHRLSTIRNADEIIVLNDGDIVEIGDHEELLKKDGFYAKLYNAQFEEAEA